MTSHDITYHHLGLEHARDLPPQRGRDDAVDRVRDHRADVDADAELRRGEEGEEGARGRGPSGA